MAVNEFQKVINDEEEIVPRKRALVPLQTDVGVFAAADPQLIDLPLARKSFHWLA